MPFRLVFMGTPAFAVPTLEALHAASHEIVAAYSQPPRPAGRRGLDLVKSPVHQAAERRGIEVRTPVNFRAQLDLEQFEHLAADAAIVVAYGLILPQRILHAPRHGCFNLHASALPRWRGAAPLQRAIMAGDRSTQAAVMRMERGLDTGPVCLARNVAIDDAMTGGELHDELSASGAALMVEALAKLAIGNLDCSPQSTEGITYAAKIDKSEARIDFTKSSDEVHNLIRALSPSPGAWFEAGSETSTERVKILRSRIVEHTAQPGEVLDGPFIIGCATGSIEPLELQRAGKRPVSAADFLRGFPITPGTILPSRP